MPELDSNDKLTLTLDTLRSDVERTPLADSTTVRRRGDQRTRRQAVGGAVAVVALVAGIAGVLGGAGLPEADHQIPATQGPTASTEVEQSLTLAADPFLTGADIGQVGEYTLQRSPDSTDALAQAPLQCMPLPETLAAAQTEGQFFYSDLDGTFREHVLRFDDSRAATAGLARLSGALAACDPGDPADFTVADRPEENVGGVSGADTAVRAARLITPVAASEPAYYELALVRERNVVVVLQWSSMGSPFNDDTTWVWTADRMQTALDTALG